MSKKTVHSAIFFSILYWIIVYFLVFKFRIVVKEINGVTLAVLIAINLILIACAGFLHSAYDIGLMIAGKIGSFVFGVISAVVYFLILTPIALIKRAAKKGLMPVKFDKEKASYYEEWEPSTDVKKQY